MSQTNPANKLKETASDLNLLHVQLLQAIDDMWEKESICHEKKISAQEDVKINPDVDKEVTVHDLQTKKISPGEIQREKKNTIAEKETEVRKHEEAIQKLRKQVKQLKNEASPLKPSQDLPEDKDEIRQAGAATEAMLQLDIQHAKEMTAIKHQYEKEFRAIEEDKIKIIAQQKELQSKIRLFEIQDEEKKAIEKITQNKTRINANRKDIELLNLRILTTRLRMSLFPDHFLHFMRPECSTSLCSDKPYDTQIEECKIRITTLEQEIQTLQAECDALDSSAKISEH